MLSDCVACCGQVIAKSLRSLDIKLVSEIGELALTVLQAPFSDPRSFKSAYKRFKFGIKKSAYMDLIQELKRDNSSLRQLADHDRARLLGRPFRRRPNFEMIRSNATSLFSSLQRSLHSACQAPHEVDLCVAALGSDRDATFRLVFHHKASLAPTWLYEEAEIISMTSKPGTEASRDNRTVARNGTVVSGKKAGRVAFAQTQAVAGTVTKSVSIGGHAAEIHDLCGDLPKLKSSRCGQCLGVLRDPSRDVRHGLFWPSSPVVDRTSLGMLSLGELLSQLPGQSLSVADTKHLAVELSACVLKLYDTPWLGKQWGRHEVTLFKKGSKILAEYPFISAKMGAVPALTCDSGHVYFQASPAIPNETVFALGILLIELCLRQPFDQLILPSELNPDGTKKELSDYTAALRLLDRVDDTAGHRYAEVVRRCVRGHFEQRLTSLKSEAFRRAVYDGVVAELQDDANQFFGRT